MSAIAGRIILPEPASAVSSIWRRNGKSATCAIDWIFSATSGRSPATGP